MGLTEEQMLVTIKDAIEKNKIAVFMKGTPAQPKCGFSAAVVDILNTMNVPYVGVDAIEDPRRDTNVTLYVATEFIDQAVDRIVDEAVSPIFSRLVGADDRVRAGVGVPPAPAAWSGPAMGCSISSPGARTIRTATRWPSCSGACGEASTWTASTATPSATAGGTSTRGTCTRPSTIPRP